MLLERNNFLSQEHSSVIERSNKIVFIMTIIGSVSGFFFVSEVQSYYKEIFLTGDLEAIPAITAFAISDVAGKAIWYAIYLFMWVGTIGKEMLINNKKTCLILNIGVCILCILAAVIYWLMLHMPLMIR